MREHRLSTQARHRFAERASGTGNIFARAVAGPGKNCFTRRTDIDTN